MKKSKTWGAEGFMKRRLRRYVASEQRKRAAEGAPAPAEKPSKRRNPQTYRDNRRDRWRVQRRKQPGLPWGAFRDPKTVMVFMRSDAAYLDGPKNIGRSKYDGEVLRAIRRRKRNHFGEVQR